MTGKKLTCQHRTTNCQKPAEYVRYIAQVGDTLCFCDEHKQQDTWQQDWQPMTPEDHRQELQAQQQWHEMLEQMRARKQQMSKKSDQNDDLYDMWIAGVLQQNHDHAHNARQQVPRQHNTNADACEFDVPQNRSVYHDELKPEVPKLTVWQTVRLWLLGEQSNDE